ncbi:GatB/YqeY domain-containing protein [Flagellatimonas centrodinii]|uniref:GatB/YqeY domain-containing protein n=1 Tax=Flagellatimonas centrodinii TaxID=2806210 RepID=UPI001FEFE444|nr:GatB/YqeY domain-containing protein [Flagellatimonas centrodinii]ULQ48102.1 GatB/YqeY domain-containing protein [Flagellatimonas centrodinii]
MTDLKLRVADDIKTAMRAGDKDRLGVLRMLSAELKQREVVESTELTDAVVIAAIEKMVKQRRDSERQFRDGDRPELAAKEAAEIAVLQDYLPQPLSDAELAALIEEAIAATGAEGGRDMGKVIGWLKPKVAGKADMGALSGRIKQRLG